MDIFPSFLKKLLSTGKVNPQSAFDLARDARLGALEDLLMKKGTITRSELNLQQEQSFSKVAETIEKMPPPPRG